MQRVLHEQHDLSDRFISQPLTRNIRVEADLVEQLFNRVDQELLHQRVQVAP